MESKLKLSEIYDKNINFIIGSGASFGLFPVLQVPIKDEKDTQQTIETLATYFENKGDSGQKSKTLLFMHYYKTCIEPILNFDFEVVNGDMTKKAVLDNYEKFIRTILYILRNKKNDDRKSCNLFTTNYDGCLAHVSDSVIKNGEADFVLNDGARGFFRRYLAAKNYNSYTKQSGTFERYSTQIPQINLIPLHGSGAWIKEGDVIRVDYAQKDELTKKCSDAIPDIKLFSDCLNDSSKSIADLEKIDIEISSSKFWEEYNKLPIVNPTKWKFHETVFEEHYYQMLRYLSYELEKPNTVLITFGFSFADEHILNLVKRSLANPKLQLFVSCFNQAEVDIISQKFAKFPNVTFLTDNVGLDFTKFNEEHFTKEKKESTTPTGNAI
jgi:hypothetical protein